MSYVRLAPTGVSKLAILFTFVGFLVGAGFLAAELSTGSLGSWLTFEPRRLRVYLSKLGAAAVGMVPLSAVGLGVIVGAVYLITEHYGVTGTSTADQRAALGWIAVRVVAVTSAGAVGGLVLGGLLRNTAAALGILVGYAILVEEIFRSLLERYVTDLRPWLVRDTFQAWVDGGSRYQTPPPVSCATIEAGGCPPVDHLLSQGHSGTFLSVVVALGAALGAWAFNRRDVT